MWHARWNWDIITNMNIDWLDITMCLCSCVLHGVGVTLDQSWSLYRSTPRWNMKVLTSIRKGINLLHCYSSIWVAGYLILFRELTLLKSPSITSSQFGHVLVYRFSKSSRTSLHANSVLLRSSFLSRWTLNRYIFLESILMPSCFSLETLKFRNFLSRGTDAQRFD